MRILFVHNCYGAFSGEEAVVMSEIELLRKNGNQVEYFSRDSSELKGFAGQAKGFLSGIYNPFSKKKFQDIISSFRPDVIHIHNMYPLVNPCILSEARAKNIPVVMTLHNYRLLCPSGLFFKDGKVCEKCLHSEWHCLFNNCEKNIFKSMGYTLRAVVARQMKWYQYNVTHYIALSEFQRNKISNALKWKEFKCSIIPNPMTGSNNAPVSPVPEKGYIACIGRVSQEKGYYLVNKIAERLPHLSFHWAGAIKIEKNDLAKKSDNLVLCGVLSRDKMRDFYSGAKFIIIPSQCYEGFPIALIEAMQNARIAIVSRTGALPELIPQMFQSRCVCAPDDLDGWCQTISSLYSDTEYCRQGGIQLKSYSEKYDEDNHYNSLISLYSSLLQDKPQ